MPQTLFGDKVEEDAKGITLFGDTTETEEPQGELIPIRRTPEQQGVFVNPNRQLDALLGDDNLDDFMPFDVKFDFGRIISQTTSPGETEDKVKLSILYKSIADIDPKISFNLQDEINKIIVGESATPTKAWGRIKERYKTGKTQVQLSDLGFDILKGTWKDWEKYDENIKNIQKLQSGISIDQRKEFRAWWEKMLGATAEQLPNMWEAVKEQPEGAIAGGLLFGLTASILAAASPTIGEEALVPAAATKGALLGAGVKGAIRIGQLEAGNMFLELASMEDQYGNRLDPRIAVVGSMSVGAINGAIELAEWAVLLKTFGITGNLFNKSVTKITRKLATDGTIRELLLRKGIQGGIAIGAETLQEIEQETSNIVFGELAKELNNAREGTDFKPITAEALKERYTEVTLESARAFGLLVLPGTTVSGIVELATQKPAATEGAKPAEGRVAEREIAAPEPDAIQDVADKFDISEDRAKAILERQAEFQREKAAPEPTQAPQPSQEAITAPEGEIVEAEKGTIEQFEDLGEQQRGKPESAMLKATTHHSGAWSWLVEHVGDLTHRMTQGVAEGQAGFGASKPKIERAFNFLRSGQFGKTIKEAHEENIINNIKHSKLSESEFRAKLKQLGEQYSAEHAKLPVFNEVQRRARDAAVALGKQDFETADEHITWLKNLIDKGEDAWNKEALKGLTPQQAEAKQPTEKVVEQKAAKPEEFKLTKTEEVAIARIEAEVEEPFEMVRVKGVGFVIKEKATGKEATVIAKRKEAKAALAEFNKQERKIKVTRRKPKLLTDKTTVGKLITEARSLKESLKKAARAAREAFTIGKREGIEKVKTHYFELKEREKERKELKTRVNKAVKSIKSKIPTSVDFFYREAIEALQAGIDPSFRMAKTLRQRERTKEFLAREPEALKDMPVKLIKALQKKSIGEYTVAELEQIAVEIEKLKKLGKLKRKLKLQKSQREIEEVRSEVEENITKGEPIKAEKEPVVYSTTKEGFVKTAWEKTKAWTWRPSRIFDMLDGGKKFAGKAHQFFVDQVNDATNAKLRMVDKRKNAGVEKMESLGVTFRELTFVRIIDDVKYTVDEMVGIYNANKNRLAKLAIMYGNNLTESNIKNITDNLSKEEKAWGDYIVQDYDNNYERLRREVIRVENRDMGFEENYTPMRRTEVDYTTHTQEIIDEILQKESLRKAYAEHGFTIKRKEVPKEFQRPIRLNATSTWLSQIAKQEQYIHFAQLVKDMHRVASGISDSVEQKFGREFNKVIRNYIDRVANPNIYKSYNSLENLSRKLRQNAVVAYLAYNLVTMAKQIPSMFLYLQDAGPVHLLTSAMEFTTHPIETAKMVREKDPQVKHRSLERELEEMKANQPGRYWALHNKFGKAGMEGLYLFDTVARSIGWNAVYQKALRSGKSEVEAVRLAQNATLRTQPAAAPKDLAQLYATNEFANWFTMFTNQLNQIYNIASYDFTGYVKNAEYQKAALTLTGLSITALTIWIIANRRLPEDAEDFAEAMGEQAINALPLVGKALMAGKRGWGGTEIPAFELPKAVGRSVAAVVEGEFDNKDLKAIAEGVAVATGTPWVGPKRVVKVAKTGELKEIVGGEPIKKNGAGTGGRKQVTRTTAGRKTVERK